MKLFYTSAIISDYYNHRKIEYIDSFNSLIQKINIEDLFNIECYLTEDSYLEEFFKNIFYSKTNSNLINKGVKEALALIKFCNEREFDDDEMIIKHTGRYKFIDDYFIRNVENNCKYDTLVRSGENNQYFTGTFAMKFFYLKDFLNSLDLVYMEDRMINIERMLYDYINKKKLNKIVYDNINVYSKINNIDTFVW